MINYTQDNLIVVSHNDCYYAECRYAECHYAECRYAECHNVCVIVLSVVVPPEHQSMLAIKSQNVSALSNITTPA